MNGDLEIEPEASVFEFKFQYADSVTGVLIAFKKILDNNPIAGDIRYCKRTL